MYDVALATAEFNIERESRALDREEYPLEIIDGIEVPKMAGMTRHSFLELRMGGILSAYGGEFGFAGTEGRIWLETGPKPTSLVPDVYFVSFDRYDDLSHEQRERLPFAPDIVAEIRSPNDRPRNIARKIELYLAHGCRLVLDADPAKRKIFAHDGESVRAYGVGDTFVHERFAWLTFDVRAFFAGPGTRGR